MLLLVPALCLPGLKAAELAVQVIGVTNTQAVLRYSPPGAGACTVEVSESAGYRPLVNDVNPAMFEGAHRDDREGSVASESTRVFVAGRRTTQRAIDGKFYSRALQAYATHYFRVTCGDATGSGQFTTANIPLGMTYSDPPQGDPENTGQHLIPTVTDSPIIDPYTGAFMKKVSNITPVAFLDFGGSTRMCGDQKVGPDAGFLCTFPSTGGRPGQLYYFIPASGEVRYLGWITSPAGVVPYPKLIADDSKVLYFQSQRRVYKGTYSGDYKALGQGAGAPFQWEILIPDIMEIIKPVAPAFEAAKVENCSFQASHQTYGQITCVKGNQDSYGWFAIYDFASRKVIAVKNMLEDPQTRWCGSHWVSLVRSHPVLTVVPQRLIGPATRAGHGPFTVKLLTDITAQQTRFQVSGEPSSAVESFLSPALTGDYFTLSLNGNTEIVRITNKVGPNEWEVQRGQQRPSRSFAYPAGTEVRAECWPLMNGMQYYWNFQTNETLIDSTLGFGHSDWSDNLRIVAGYLAVQGPIVANLSSPVSFQVSNTIAFAGAAGLAEGNATAKHPSYHQQAAPPSEQNWFLDMQPFNGGNLFSNNPGVELIEGKLYKYKFSTVFRQRLNRKQLPTLASSGGSLLKDISGPSSLITEEREHAYTYCVAQLDGECRPDSRAGDAYVNAPGLQFNYCAGGDGPNPTRLDACLTDMPMYAQGITQLGFTPNTLGLTSLSSSSRWPIYGAAYSRVLARGLGGVKAMTGLAKPLPDGSWLFFNTADQNTLANKELMMVKVPPTPEPDGVDRSTFLRVPISVPAAGIPNVSTAVVYFGYHENGPPNEFLCTSRKEACAAVSGDPSDSDPFKFATVEQYGGVPCSNGCTVTVPAIPMRVVYFEVRYLNEAGEVVGRGPAGVAAENSVTIL